MLFKLSNPNSNLALTLGYLNLVEQLGPALYSKSRAGDGRCHFQDTYNFFDLLLRVFLSKRNKIATQGQTRPRTRTFRIVISLPYHCTTTPTRQSSEKFKYI